MHWIAPSEKDTANAALEKRLKKSRYLTRTIKELVSNSVMLSRQIKGIDNSNIKAPKPHVGDSHPQG